MPTKTKTKRDIYQEVTDTIIQALEDGYAPWRKPWRPILDDVHRNFVSKKPYRGVNVFLLDIVAQSRSYEFPYWLTFNQAKAKGGKIRKGESGTLVVFWKVYSYEDEKDLTKDGKPKKKTGVLLRHYVVFNIAQTEGIEMPKVEVEPFDPIERAQAAIDNLPDPSPTIRHRGDSAFYQLSGDLVSLPKPQAFRSREDYYRTAYHELGHATAHESRLNRNLNGNFGSEPYAKEELVAEMTSAMVAATVGIDGTDQSAAYVGGWLKALQDDRKLVVHAASKAQQAADWIRGEHDMEDES